MKTKLKTILTNMENKNYKVIEVNNKIPTRCGELTPLESSGYTLVELGNKNLHNFM